MSEAGLNPLERSGTGSDLNVDDLEVKFGELEGELTEIVANGEKLQRGYNELVEYKLVLQKTPLSLFFLVESGLVIVTGMGIEVVREVLLVNSVERKEELLLINYQPAFRGGGRVAVEVDLGVVLEVSVEHHPFKFVLRASPMQC